MSGSNVERLPRAEVLGVGFVSMPFTSMIDEVVAALGREDRHALYLCPSGVHGVVEAQKDPDFRQILNQAAFNVPDGKPIVFLSRFLGFPETQRAFGPDVMWSILGRSVEQGTRHFFYGGREGVADALAQRCSVAFPGLKVAGTYCPPFRPLTVTEKESVIDMITTSGADVVWVGLSTPKQERWIAEMRDHLDVKLLCSVGAAFDYHTGALKPAPTWMQRVALEWLFRLLQEPRRLWRRYAEIVPTFLVLVALQVSGLKKFPRARDG